jgi:hypothetical protein
MKMTWYKGLLPVASARRGLGKWREYLVSNGFLSVVGRRHWSASPCRRYETIAACAARDRYNPQDAEEKSSVDNFQSRTINDVTVSVAILTDEQAEQHFGEDLDAQYWPRVT